MEDYIFIQVGLMEDMINGVRCDPEKVKECVSIFR
jgi:hypothetical protein